ncbi:sirohydrochlorin ferrochelatase [bacteria symbiont BFo2 of Frankliniella occidentalis]|nr:sirohydrochlorin ferrochelatase [bacteria symbiont BFo2 of Frankliniella occidentalis]KYP95262.1 sirohydrochlorin ferrochelatase [bacteria symbiont BFo2 of Frankliniella occidentalis]
MDYLPLFAELKNRPVLVIGGGEIASRKIDLLLRANAIVHIAARELSEEVSALVNDKKVLWIAKEYQASYIDQVFFVIAATDDSVLNERVYQDAQSKFKLVNVVDDQARCSFIFPSIVDRSPIIVAISSAGTAPVLARSLREKIETLLPARLGDAAQLAGQWRDRVKQHFHRMADRRRFWERLFNGEYLHHATAGNLPQAEKLLAESLDDPISARGEIYLVGGGPGDPGLLTLRGLQVMQLADVVLYDHLVSEEVLDLVRRDAERICVGKRAGAHSVPQEETNQLLVTLALQGKKVVRLKGGDPFIFGRGGEELEAAVAANIPFQVVPGITAAAGATAYAGIPLTHRDYAQSAVFITGHCRKDGREPDWASLALSDQTLAIYMGTVKAAEISRRLIEHGRAAETPVAVIGRGTRQNQQVLTGRLDQLADLAAAAPTPALVVIGEVVHLHKHLAWFQKSSASITSSSALTPII